MTLLRATKIKGVTAAIGVAVLQGMEGIIFTLFGLVLAVAALVDQAHFSITVVLLRETIIFLILSLFFAPRWRKLLVSLRRRETRYYLLSGVFTAIGNTFYILGIAFAGSAYGVVLTSFYPLFSLFLFNVLFKERQNAKVWFGVVLTLVGGLLFILLPNLVTAAGNTFNVERVLGMIFGMLSALFWAVEAITIKRGLQIGNQKRSPSEATYFRTAGSWFFTLILLFPISFAFGDAAGAMASTLSSWPAMLIVLGIAALVVTLRFIHIYAIQTIGPKLTAIIDNNNFLVPPLCTILLTLTGAVNAATGAVLFEPFVWWAWLLTIPLLVGVFIALYFERTPPSAAAIVLDRVQD